MMFSPVLTVLFFSGILIVVHQFLQLRILRLEPPYRALVIGYFPSGLIFDLLNLRGEFLLFVKEESLVCFYCLQTESALCGDSSSGVASYVDFLGLLLYSAFENAFFLLCLQLLELSLFAYDVELIAD